MIKLLNISRYNTVLLYLFKENSNSDPKYKIEVPVKEIYFIEFYLQFELYNESGKLLNKSECKNK